MFGTSQRIIFAVFIFFSVSNAEAAPLAVKCGHIFDATNGVLHDKVVINIEDEKIISIDRMPTKGVSEIIDLSDYTCLPGLIDAHTHLMPDNILRPEEKISSALKTMRILKNAKTLLTSGFTTVRIPGDGAGDFSIVEIRQAIADGMIPGPRLFVAPHRISPVGGLPDLLHVTGGKEKIREAVKRELDAGADWIKIMSLGETVPEETDPTSGNFTFDELKIIIDETHAREKKITAHVFDPQPAYVLAELGIDSIEHAVNIDRKAAKAMVANNVRLVSTAYVLDWTLEQNRGVDIPAGFYDAAKIAVQRREKAWKVAIEEGVIFVFGSDQIFPHEKTGREFFALTKAGLTPVQALQSATVNAADLLGISDMAGSLEAGKWADIVAVPGNPLSNIRQLEDIPFVMQAGKVIKHEGISTE